MKKKCGFFLAGSSKCHSIMRRMFISSTFQKSYSKTVYFREILLRFFYWVSTWLVYTLIQLNSPWKGENCLKKNYLIRLWKEKCINIFVFVFRKRGTVRHIYMVLFIETCNQTCSSILWRGNEGRLHFRPTLITKKNTGLRLMVWKTLEHNFRFCVGLGNNLITFMPPFCVLSEGRQTQTHIIFTIRRVSCLFPLIYLISKKNHFE